MSERGASHWSADKEALVRAGFRPSKRLGQNFLVDANLARAIARDGGAAADELVLEIGPGTGVLTRELLAAGGRVLAVEIDDRLVEHLRAQFAGEARFELIHADALAGKRELAPELLERLPGAHEWRLIANLPYSAGTPILLALARLANSPQSMTALLQRELAERLAASPGGKDWGAPTVKLQARYTVEIVRRVPAALFWPAPEVESAVVRMRAHEKTTDRGALELLDSLAELLFQGRRKTVGRLLADALGDRPRALSVCSASGVDSAARPEELSIAELLALAQQRDLAL